MLALAIHKWPWVALDATRAGRTTSGSSVDRTRMKETDPTFMSPIESDHSGGVGRTNGDLQIIHPVRRDP
jgi:hypothetical protein